MADADGRSNVLGERQFFYSHSHRPGFANHAGQVPVNLHQPLVQWLVNLGAYHTAIDKLDFAIGQRVNHPEPQNPRPRINPYYAHISPSTERYYLYQKGLL